MRLSIQFGHFQGDGKWDMNIIRDRAHALLRLERLVLLEESGIRTFGRVLLCWILSHLRSCDLDTYTRQAMKYFRYEQVMQFVLHRLWTGPEGCTLPPSFVSTNASHADLMKVKKRISSRPNSGLWCLQGDQNITDSRR
jgi:hypothetical protein